MGGRMISRLKFRCCYWLYKICNGTVRRSLMWKIERDREGKFTVPVLWFCRPLGWVARVATDCCERFINDVEFMKALQASRR